MECHLNCRVCWRSFRSATGFKTHLHSPAHLGSMTECFPEAQCQSIEMIPNIVFVDPYKKHQIYKPVFGFSFLTLCFDSKLPRGFYMCHICQEVCSLQNIVKHIYSQNHNSHLDYIDPDEASFSEVGKADVEAGLKESGSQTLTLQMLHLPTEVMEKVISKVYSEVMEVFKEREKLVSRFEDILKKRTLMQAYQDDSKRKIPLVGMEHIIECICVGPPEERHYLCTLCKLTVAHNVFEHIRSIQHIDCYIKAYHPSCTEYKVIASMMLEEGKTYESACSLMKQMHLKPSQYKKMDFGNYFKASKKLESFSNISFLTNIKSECLGTSGSHPPSSSLSPSSEKAPCALYCQICYSHFNEIGSFLRHLSGYTHITLQRKVFGEALGDYEISQKVNVYLGLYSYINQAKSVGRPVVGTSLVLTCISSKVKTEPLHLCFACLESFLESKCRDHFESQTHIVNTLLCLNPWRLPFAWENNLDLTILRLLSNKEKNEHNYVVLKVLDVPHATFQNLIPNNYCQVLSFLDHHHHMALTQCVPQNSHQTEFPLLGMEFLVVYDAVLRKTMTVKSLCSLCKKLLTRDETKAHVFSREHVIAFLETLHPGSVNPTTVDSETLLDLAKQARQIHPTADIRKIHLDDPIREPRPYIKVFSILNTLSMKWEKRGISPKTKPGVKLVPKSNQKAVAHEPLRKKPEASLDSDILGSIRIKQEKVEEIFPVSADSQMVKGTTQTPTLKRKSAKIGKSYKSPDKTDDPLNEDQENSNSSKQLGDNDKRKKRKHLLSEGISFDQDFQQETKSKSRRNSSITDKEAFAHIHVHQIKKEKFTDELKIHDFLIMGTLVECRCNEHAPIYFCGSCSQKILEKDAIAHVTEVDHQKMTRVVFHVDETIFLSISGQSFQSAIQTLRALDLGLQFSLKLPSTFETPPETKKTKSPTCTQVCFVAESKAVAMGAGNVEDGNTPTESSGATEETLEIYDAASGRQLSVNMSNLESRLPNDHIKMDVTQSTELKLAKKNLPPERGRTITGKGNMFTSTSAALSKTAPTFAAPVLNGHQATVSHAVLRVGESVAVGSLESKVSCKLSSSSNLGSTKNAQTASTFSAFGQCEATPRPLSFSVKYRNAGACTKAAHRRHSADPYVRVRPHVEAAVDHINAGMSAGFEHEELQKEPFHITASKTASGNPLKVGANHLAVISCEGKQQVYCMLCLVKLNSSSAPHLTSPGHHHKYVKLKCPGWTATQSEFEVKLTQTVTHLAKLEKANPHSRNAQKLEVTKATYQDLRNLPGDKAVEKVKAFLKGKDQQISVSSSVTDTECLRHDAADTCEVSSSNDAAQELQTEISESLDKDSPTQEHHEPMRDTHDFIRDACLHQDKACGDSSKNDLELIPASSVICEALPDMVVQELALNEEPLPHVKTTPVYESADLFRQDQHTHLKSAERLRPDQILTSEMQSFTSKIPEKEEDHAVLEPETSATMALPTGIVLGGKAQASGNLSKYLEVKMKDKPVIGLSCIWECQGTVLKTLFLCECCEEKLSLRDICQHMVCFEHQLKYLTRDYPKYLEMFWLDTELLLEMKIDILKDVVLKLWEQECELNMVAQCVRLSPDLHSCVWKAPFNEALKIVQQIKNEENGGLFHLPISAVQQETSRAGKEMSTAGDLKRHEDGEKSSFCAAPQNTAQSVDCGMEERSLQSLVDPAASPAEDIGTCLTPHFYSSGSLNLPQVGPSASQPETTDSTEVDLREEALDPAFSDVVTPSSNHNLTSSFGNESSLRRKRPAGVSIEKLFENSNDSQPDCSLPSVCCTQSATCSPTNTKMTQDEPANPSTEFLKDQDLRVLPICSTEKFKVLERVLSALKKNMSTMTFTSSVASNSNTSDASLSPKTDEGGGSSQFGTARNSKTPPENNALSVSITSKTESVKSIPGADVVKDYTFTSHLEQDALCTGSGGACEPTMTSTTQPLSPEQKMVKGDILQSETTVLQSPITIIERPRLRSAVYFSSVDPEGQYESRNQEWSVQMDRSLMKSDPTTAVAWYGSKTQAYYGSSGPSSQQVPSFESFGNYASVNNQHNYSNNTSENIFNAGHAVNTFLSSGQSATPYSGEGGNDLHQQTWQQGQFQQQQYLHYQHLQQPRALCYVQQQQMSQQHLQQHQMYSQLLQQEQMYQQEGHLQYMQQQQQYHCTARLWQSGQ